MRVEALIEILQSCNPDAEVRILVQPNYPLESAVAGVTTDADIAEDRDMEDNGIDSQAAQVNESVVYLLDGGQIGYGPRNAWLAHRR